MPHEATGSARWAALRGAPLALLALVLGGLTATAVAVGAPVPVRIALVVLFACLGPGAAIVSQLRRTDVVTTIALTVIGSLTVFAAVATVALWLHRWAPAATVGWLAVIAAASGVVALVRQLSAARRSPPPGPGVVPGVPGAGTVPGVVPGVPGAGTVPDVVPGALPGSVPGVVPGGVSGSVPGVVPGAVPVVVPLPRAGEPAAPRAGSGATPAWRWLLDAALVMAALAAWAVALAKTDVDTVGGFGLLATVHPLFFVAPVLCVAGFVAELARGARRGPVLVAYLAVLVLVIHASTPMLLAEPQYAWTYKHIGVIESFADHGGVSGGGDIYQQWPAFFGAAAQLAGAGGVTALQLAPWAPLFFNAVGAVLLFTVARTLSPDRRVAFGTVLVFECVNWIEEDYLSPQGLAFVLSLGVFYLVLRYLRVQPLTGRASRLARWLHSGALPVPEVSQTGRLCAIGAVAVLMAVLSASHQLSPYLVSISIIALVALRLVRPWWIALVLVALPVAYLVPRFGFVSGSFGIFDGMNLFRNAGGTSDAWGTVGQAFSAVTVRALSLTVWALVAVAAYRSRRALGRLLVPLTLALVPFGLVLVQSYGGEAIYRVFLFSAPWSAYLIADLAPRLSWPRPVKASVATAALVLAVLATMQGRHGQLMVDRQSADSVTAARYLYANGQHGATVVLAAPDFPSRLTANYGDFNRTISVGEPDLVKGAGLKGATFYGEYLPAIESFARSFDGTTVYLVLSNEMADYTTYFGYEPAGAMTNLRTTLDRAPEWTVFYRNPDVTIYQLR